METSVVSDEITGALLDQLEERANRNGFRSLMGTDSDVAGALAASGNLGSFQSTSDTEGIIYATDTGEPRLIPAVYMRKTLGKRRGAKAAFVAGDPKTGQPLYPVPEYRLGTHMCFLHPLHPDRAELEQMGIGPEIVCGDNETTPAAHIRDEFNLRLHESKKHPISWAIREQARAQRERDEQRDEQRRHTEAILALAQQNAGGTRQKAG